ncbi:MAG: exo-alpha-sialidase [Chlamydiia bacterium]|nr:exo-alpha-sialidase [Chlamydiia bacterium]
MFVQKISDKAPHNAFTDLIRFQDRWFVIFREADLHAKGSLGALRLLSSSDGAEWKSIAHLTHPEWDLRDPKLSLRPDGKLLLTAGATIWEDEETIATQQSIATLSLDGSAWEPFQRTLPPHEWLWKVTWHQGTAYGVAYNIVDEEWVTSLWTSQNGLQWKKITTFDIPNRPNETALAFAPDNTLYALVRRNAKPARLAYFGTSSPPYTTWEWTETKEPLNCPALLCLEGMLFTAGRLLAVTPYGIFAQTLFGQLENVCLSSPLFLPSRGDCGYPGLLFHNNTFWLSYYSSHEGKSAIYFSCLY